MAAHRNPAPLVGALVVLLWALPLVDTLSAHRNLSFIATRDLIVGSRPQWVATGELNGDGVQDLVVSNQGSNHVSVLIGHGDGTFQPPQNFAVLSLPQSVTVGDFNLDMLQDLVVVHALGNGSILLGNGDGTFQPAQSFLAGGQVTQSITVGEFNWDGVPDLTVVFHSGGPLSQGAVNVLLGNGDGTFQPPRTFGTGRTSSSGIVGDFNGDWLLDLAVSNRGSNNVSILLGNGDGTFQPARNFGAGSGPSSVTVGDFNGDGGQDLAVANQGSDDVSVLLGNGDGTFQPAQDFQTGTDPSSVTVGDFNWDDQQDLAVAVLGSVPGPPGAVQILLGGGDGTFQPAQGFGTLRAPVSLAVGDFNGDGAEDLASANRDSDTVSILLGRGDGTLRSEPNFAAGSRPHAITVGDFNGDWQVDLAVTNLVSLPGTETGSVSILLGNGDGNFQPFFSVEARRFPWSIAIGDFNGDALQDLAASNFGSVGPESAIVSVFLGDGDGSLQPAQDFGPVRRAQSVVVGDFNGDGLQDLAVVHGGSSLPEDAVVSVLLGNGDGTFQPEQGFATGSGPSSAAVGDFNSDGLQDLAVSNRFSESVSILIGNGDGTFQAAQDIGLGKMPTSVVVGDVNRDGLQDLAVANRLFFDTARVPIVSILLGNGDGTFQPALDFGPESRAESILIADFDRDGYQDLAAGNVLFDTASVLLGNGDGTFEPAQNFGVGRGSVTSGDFNRDRRRDLAVVNGDAKTVSILTNATRRRRPRFPSPRSTPAVDLPAAGPRPENRVDTPASPTAAPPPGADLRVIVEPFMDWPGEHRRDFDRVDPTAWLREQYEAFWCDLEQTGFTVFESSGWSGRGLIAGWGSSPRSGTLCARSAPVVPRARIGIR